MGSYAALFQLVYAPLISFPQENLKASDLSYPFQGRSYSHQDIADELFGENTQGDGGVIYVKRELLTLRFQKTCLQKVSQTLNVIQGELPGLGFQGFISGYGDKLLDVAEGRPSLSTMHLYLGCVILLETFSEDNIVVFAKEVCYLIEGDI